MTRIFLILLTISIVMRAQRASAQTREALLGNWKVYDVGFDEKDSVVSELDKMLRRVFFVEATYSFGHDSIYRVHISDMDEKGKWWIDKMKRKIFFMSEEGSVAHKGTITDIDVIEIKTDGLVLKKDNLALMLKRVD